MILFVVQGKLDDDFVCLLYSVNWTMILFVVQGKLDDDLVCCTG